MEIDSTKLIRTVAGSKRIGIFTVGGGVPRNFVQNVAPLMDLINKRCAKKFPHRKFSYGCRICPDPSYFGHLSGCTYHEGKSWGKMSPRGKFAEVHADATIVLPFIVKYAMEVKQK